MAALAFRRAVSADQGEVSHRIMVERHLVPGVFAMASGAILPVLAFVFVIAHMATEAGNRRRCDQRLFDMTGSTLCLAMRAAQGKFSQAIMVEAYTFPAGRNMAGLTLRTIAAIMHVFSTMAAGTVA